MAICVSSKLRLTAIAFSALLSLPAQAQGPPSVATFRRDPHELVYRAVQNELADMEGRPDFWRYRLRKETNSGTQVKDLVETKDGIVARTVSLNDQPLTPEQRAQDDDKLAKLASDPEEQRKKQREQMDEVSRVKKMIQALPDALLY